MPCLPRFAEICADLWSGGAAASHMWAWLLWSTLDVIILERLSGSLLHTHPTQLKDVISHTTRLLTSMLPSSLESRSAFRPRSGPGINLSSVTSLQSSRREINAYLDHKKMGLYFSRSTIWNHSMVGVNSLWRGWLQGHSALIPGFSNPLMQL